ncbi:MAG: zinc ribbon domain-containing protein [Anaerolineales bacterium]|nr:zinc ribbon domain-containing protein [Anaerolineales bacterium]
MDIGAIFFILAVVTLVGMYVSQPYIQRRGRHAMQEDREYSSLMAEYDRAVNTLQELDFDNALGKIPAEDYPRQRTELLAKGTDLLRKLDALTPVPSTLSGTRPSGRGGRSEGKDAESRMEAAVASRRADASAQRAATVLDDDELESMLAARRKTRKEKSAGFCPKCGKPILVSDRFCPSCGKAIN